MEYEIYTIQYPDKDTAKLVYKQLSSLYKELGIISYGLESYRARSKRARNRLKLVIVLHKDKAKNIPSILKIIERSLSDHPLFDQLSFDSTALPLSQVKWNFDSYDDPSYQKIFTQKRQRESYGVCK